VDPTPDFPPPPPSTLAGPLPPPPASAPATRTAPHLDLRDLPLEVARKLSFDRAAPKRLRQSDVPPEARQVVAGVWDSVVADVWDEVRGTKRRDLRDKDRITAIVARILDRLQHGERALLVAGVYYPMPGDAGWKHAGAAGAGSAGAAAAGSLALVGSAGTAAAVAITTAVVGELFETYVASSARTRQYLRARREPDPSLIAMDLAEALGYTDNAGRRSSRALTTKALGYLAKTAGPRATSRILRGLVPVAGAVAAGGMAWRDVQRVAALELRPPSPEEVARMAGEIDDEQAQQSPDSRFDDDPTQLSR